MPPDQRMTRITNSLASLIELLLPALPNEPIPQTDARHEAALDLATSILQSRAADSPAYSSMELVEEGKKRILRIHNSQEAIRRFENACARLGAVTVLQRRKEVLVLLNLLAGSPAPAPVGPPPQASTATTVVEEPLMAGLHRMPRPQSGDPSGGLQAQWGTERVIESGRVKASLVAEVQPSEKEMLKSLPFMLLGVGSSEFPFEEKEGAAIVGGVKVLLPKTLPVPYISLLHALAEPSLLYKSLEDFVKSPSQEGGLVGQSLRAAVDVELRGYLALIGGLEGEIRRALAMEDARKTGVTLKRCVVWTREATMGLRLMGVVVEETKNKKGGQLISTIHSFATSHGDPFVHSFAERLLSRVTVPFYHMLQRWIYSGELSDPFEEFFVSETPNVAPTSILTQFSIGAPSNPTGRAMASSVWESKYKLEEEMVPSIITEDFSKKIFLIGKSLNFIRFVCGDSDWVEAHSKDLQTEFKYGDAVKLNTSVEEAYKATTARLIHLMAERFNLFEHLRAMKRYILLGQGDFIALLMESLSSSLERPSSALYRHNLTAQLEHAIRNSNAQFESADVIRRLDARLLDTAHGEVGWDVFTLEYKIDAPVDVVITPLCNREYLKVFNFLWRIKRVEYALSQAWRKYMTGARGVLGSVSAQLGEDWKHSRCVLAEMLHFVMQLQYYILFEVIESSWNEFMEAIKNPRATLDDVIDAHRSYLSKITEKALLAPRDSRGKLPEGGYLPHLHEIFKIMLRYRDSTEALYSHSIAVFTRTQEAATRIETRTKKGEWGIQDSDFPSGAGSFEFSSATDSTDVENVRAKLTGASREFKTRVVMLLAELANQNVDANLKMLGMLLNFNGVYVLPTRRRKRRGEKEREGD